MKVYIATAFELFKDAEHAVALLEKAGHTITASWIPTARSLNGSDKSTTDPDLRRKEAEICLKDIRKSDVLLLLAPAESGCGMWVELGYTLGLIDSNWHKRVMMVGYGKERTLFCELNDVESYASVEDAIAAMVVAPLVMSL
jgi:hypothetical protein